MKEHIRFIINPISGVGKKNTIPPLIEKYLDHKKFDYNIVYTVHKSHAIEIAANAANEGVDVVCAVGGDGSVHEVGIALLGTKTKLAIIPAGSGNGLARHLKIPLKFKHAIACINASNMIVMDTVRVNDRPFLGVAGFGFDAFIAKKFDEHHTRGFLSYVYLTIRDFLRYDPIKATVEINGETRELSVVLLTVANSSQYGNGFTVSPDSDVTDGQLELVLLEPFSLWSMPAVIFRFFTKRKQRSRYSEIIPFKEARIYSSNTLAHFDGEPGQVTSDLKVQVVPKSLHIIVGKTT